jgi:drug/metabolite transporter (DMT)-like permease
MNAALLGLVGALSWGLHDFLARFPSRKLGPTNTTFLVTATGFVALTLWIILVNGTPDRLAWSSSWLAAVAGIFSALATLALFTALTLGPVSIVTPIAGAFPAPALLFAVIGGLRPTHVEWLAMASVLAGVALVSQSGERHQATGAIEPGKLKSVVGFSLLAGLSFAVSLTAGQAAAPALGSIETAWLARVFALVTVALLYLRPSVEWQQPGRWLPFLAFMGCLDVLALTTIMAAGHMPNPAVATVVASSFSAVSVVLARIVLKEIIVPIQLIGMALIFGGVAVLAGS